MKARAQDLGECPSMPTVLTSRVYRAMCLEAYKFFVPGLSAHVAEILVRRMAVYDTRGRVSAEAKRLPFFYVTYNEFVGLMSDFAAAWLESLKASELRAFFAVMARQFLTEDRWAGLSEPPVHTDRNGAAAAAAAALAAAVALVAAPGPFSPDTPKAPASRSDCRKESLAPPSPSTSTAKRGVFSCRASANKCPLPPRGTK